MKRIAIVFLLITVNLFAQDKPEQPKQKTPVEVAQEKLQQLQEQAKQLEAWYNERTGEYHRQLDALQIAAQVHQQTIKENEVKKEEKKQN